MIVTFLGTSGSLPTKKRASSSIVIKRKNELFMFDCGEGTQRQMVRAHIGFQKISKIFITHLHGDHVLGIPGLIQSMSLLHREKLLDIYGPSGLIQFIKAVADSIGGPSFPVIIHEINEPGTIFESKEYVIESIQASHRIESWSYSIKEKPRPGKFYPDKAKKLGVPEGVLWGKLQHGEQVIVNGVVIKPEEVTDSQRRGRQIVYSGDTRPNEGLVKLAEGADLLIHESTFGEELTERANNDGHTTAKQAAEIAKKARVDKLVLTHISARYSNPEVLLQEAIKVFKNVEIAEDLMTIKVHFKD